MHGKIENPDVTTPEVVDDLAVSLNKDGQTNAAAALKPDQSMAEQFFKAIASHPGDIMFEYRTFDDNHDRTGVCWRGSAGQSRKTGRGWFRRAAAVPAASLS